MRIALREHKERQNACAFPLHSAALVETSHISLGDCFAAQIVYHAIARKGVGGLCDGTLPAYVPVSD